MRPILLVTALMGAACGGGGDDIPPGPDAGPPDGGLPDAPTECPPTPPPVCDYFLHCGCDTPNEKCSPSGTGPMCFLVGTGDVGTVCDSEDDCLAGLACLAFEGLMRCMELCDQLHPCPFGQACYVTVTDSSSNIIGRVCGVTCDLLTQDCTFPGKACYPQAAVVGIPERGVCVTEGSGVQDAACSRANDCAKGYTCANVGGSPRCGKLCDRQDNDPACGSGESCQALTGHTRTGVCVTN